MLWGSWGNATGGRDRSDLFSTHMGKASKEGSDKKLVKAAVTVVGISMSRLAFIEIEQAAKTYPWTKSFLKTGYVIDRSL